MKKLLLYLPVLIFLVLIFKSCSYENPISASDEQQAIEQLDGSSSIFATDLVLSDNTKIGRVSIDYGGLGLNIIITIRNSSYIKNIHFSYSENAFTIPVTGHCPNIENFIVQVHNLPSSTKRYAISIPKNKFSDTKIDVFFGALQVEFENLNNDPKCNVAWANGRNFPNCSSFGKYFTIKDLIGDTAGR
jgi:hypothetical protein